MNKRTKVIVLFIVISISLTLSIFSFAKYTSNYVHGYYLKSKGFYFESDTLKNDKNIANMLWDGDSVSFTLKNYSNENLITDYDIRYDLTCEVLTKNIEASCTLNDTKKNNVSLVLSSNAQCINDKKDNVDVSKLNKTECEVGGYTWKKEKVNQINSFNISFKNENDKNKEIDVKITASSTSPYKKTLSAIYKLQKNEKSSGDILSTSKIYGSINEYIITNTYNENKCLLIRFNSSNRVLDVTSDTTNLGYDSNNYVNQFKILLEADSTKKVVFFPRSSVSNLLVNDVVISQSSGCN